MFLATTLVQKTKRTPGMTNESPRTPSTSSLSDHAGDHDDRGKDGLEKEHPKAEEKRKEEEGEKVAAIEENLTRR